jgi:predicted TIM-barrel fold metal-dependent hydrolase
MPSTPHVWSSALPPVEALEGYEIWDSYFTATNTGPEGSGLPRDVELALPTLDRAAIRRLCLFLHVGLGTTDPETDAWLRAHPDAILRALDRWPGRFLGMIQLNPNDVPGSLDAIHRWLRDGPMVGVYFPGGRWGSLVCTHRNYDPLVRRTAELGGLIMQHNWFKTGGKESPGESTPSDLAELARRFPEVRFISAHAGGEWEQGLRAVRGSPNVLVETSGFDPTAGFIDMAVRELGAERIVFGSHLPSRSLGTELGKVLSARISEADRRLILGANLRRLLMPILRRKGLV